MITIENNPKITIDGEDVETLKDILIFTREILISANSGYQPIIKKHQFEEDVYSKRLNFILKIIRGL